MTFGLRSHDTLATCKHVIFLTGILLTAGCSLTPTYHPPTAPIAASYPVPEAAAAASSARVGWRDFFVEPELQELIERSLENNRDLKVAAARIEQARANARLQGASRLPSLAANGGMTTIGVPDNLEPVLGDSTRTNFGTGLQASWELDFFGRLGNLHAAAREQFLASEASREALTSSIVAQVATAYLQDRSIAERLAVAREALANREHAVRLMQRRYEVGSGSKIEVTQAQSLRTQAAGEIEQLELQRAQNLNALQLLVGEPLAPNAFQAELKAASLEQEIPAGLPSDLLLNRPDIIAAEHKLRAQYADIGAARAAFFPSISLTGIAQTASDDLGGLFDPSNALWVFRPRVSLPIFTGGKLKGQLALQEAERDQALAEYEKAIQSAFRDVADGLAQRQWLAAQVVTANEAVAASQERSRLAQLRFDHGRGDYLDVLDAERDLFTTRQRWFDLRRAWLASGVSLYAALGGGSFQQFDNQEQVQ